MCGCLDWCCVCYDVSEYGVSTQHVWSSVFQRKYEQDFIYSYCRPLLEESDEFMLEMQSFIHIVVY